MQGHPPTSFLSSLATTFAWKVLSVDEECNFSLTCSYYIAAATIFSPAMPTIHHHIELILIWLCCSLLATQEWCSWQGLDSCLPVISMIITITITITTINITIMIIILPAAPQQWRPAKDLAPSPESFLPLAPLTSLAIIIVYFTCREGQHFDMIMRRRTLVERGMKGLMMMDNWRNLIKFYTHCMSPSRWRRVWSSCWEKMISCTDWNLVFNILFRADSIWVGYWCVSSDIPRHLCFGSIQLSGFEEPRTPPMPYKNPSALETSGTFDTMRGLHPSVF